MLAVDGLNELWLNNGAGFFTLVSNAFLDIDAYTWKGVPVDVDGDQDVDVLFANDLGEYFEVWLNGGGGQFDLVLDPILPGSDYPDFDTQDLAVGDIDGDGDPDLVMANLSTNFVWLNDGTGHYQLSASTLGTSTAYAVSLGDLDQDGDLDAVLGNEEDTEVWLNDGKGAFHLQSLSLGGGPTLDISLGDMDGDGLLDVATVGLHREPVLWMNTHCPLAQPDVAFLQQGGGAQATWFAKPGRYYQAEWSANLADWTPLPEVEGAGAFMLADLAGLGPWATLRVCVRRAEEH